MNEKEKDALIQVKHFNNITRYWQEEEYEEKEIKKYITTILNLIEKQEEIIQAMAGKISEYKDYLEGIPEDDMWHEKCFLYNKISDCYAYNDCEECIIEFYSKKVGE